MATDNQGSRTFLAIVLGGIVLALVIAAYFMYGNKGASDVRIETPAAEQAPEPAAPAPSAPAAPEAPTVPETPPAMEAPAPMEPPSMEPPAETTPPEEMPAPTPN